MYPMWIKRHFQCEFYRFIHDKNGVRVSKGEFQSRVNIIKVECIFPMVISSEFRMKHYRHDDHREDTTHFNKGQIIEAQRIACTS